MHRVSCSRAVPCWTWVHLQLTDKTATRCNDAKATQLLQQVYDNSSLPWESSRRSRVCCLPPVNYFEGEICCFFCLCCIILWKRSNKSSIWHYVLHLMLTKSEYLGERVRIKWWCFLSVLSKQPTIWGSGTYLSRDGSYIFIKFQKLVALSFEKISI